MRLRISSLRTDYLALLQMARFAWCFRRNRTARKTDPDYERNDPGPAAVAIIRTLVAK